MFLLLKSTFAKIRKSFGRFLSIVLIVALGTGFFAGLREAAPDMLSTVDHYYRGNQLMDFKITSTMGLTDDDIKSLENLNNTAKVVPSYSIDVLVNGEAVKLHAIEKNINNITLKSGRLPKNKNECLGDANHFKLNEKISFTKDNLNNFTNISSCQITGLIDSVLYISTEKGISSEGNGKLESFIFLPKEAFSLEYYTEAYLIASGTDKAEAYSSDYDQNIATLKKELEVLKPLQETKRYEEILAEATKEIAKAEDELNNKLKEAKTTLTNTKNELDSNKAKIDNGLAEIARSETTLAQESQSKQQEITDGLQSIANKRQEIINTLASFNLIVDNLENTLTNLKSAIENCQTNCEQLNTQYQTLSTINESLNTLNKTETELNQNKQTLQTSISQAQKKLAKQKQQLLANKAELEAGFKAYEEGLQELENNQNEALAKINEQKEKLNTLEKPVWYLLDRTANNGYTSFYEDASKVEAIAKVFPIFFILVAGLMGLNTMTRLIEEERTEIGILTSLGYSQIKIISGYIFYCLLATFIGVAVGLSVGYYLIPTVVYSIYNANYVLPDLFISAKPVQFSFVFTCAAVLMSAVTIYVTMRDLKEKPAILLRPKAPKNGKKVLLEKISFIWKHLSFTWKITIRNIFRYKKRVFMTLIGIAGCTALLLTGFGLKDGINGIGTLQYEDIQKYDTLISLKDNVETIPSNLINSLENNHVTDAILVNQEAYTFTAKNKNHDVYVISPENAQALNKHIKLHSTITEKDTTLPDYGAVITSKMAKLLNVSPGDTIKIRDSQNHLYILYVADITENYIMHYIYLSPSYYKEIINNQNTYNMVMANVDSQNYDQVSTNLLKNEYINAINYTKDNMESYDIIIKGMNKIVYLIIGAAILLALIVLYNLVIINMNERQREIATLKVLGFKGKEISSYVYRETIILMIIGIIIGIFLGLILHGYVIITAETDNIVFLQKVNLLSYVYAILLTILSSIIVQIITYRYLLKIDMIESLKALDQ